MQDREKTGTELLAEIDQLRRRLVVLERDGALADQTGRVMSVKKAFTQIEEAQGMVSQGEQLLQATLDAITESVLVLDRSGVFCAVNQTAAERLGCRVKDMVGVNCREMGSKTMPLAVREARLAHLDKVLQTGMLLRLVDEWAGLFFDQTYYPIFDAANCVSHVVIFAADITARIDAQRELEESQARYRELMENVGDIIYSTDRDGTLSSISEAAKRLLGFDREEIVGTHYRQWIPEDQLPRLDAARRAALEGERVVVEVGLFDRSGDEHHMEISVGPIVTGGAVSGTQGIIRDITERRRIETALRDSEAKYRNLVEGIVDVIVSVDREGCIQWANHVVKDMLGYELSDVVGKRLSGFVLGEKRDAVQAMLERVLEGKSVKSETVLVARDGALVHAEYSAAPVTKGAQIVGIQCAVWDVTQRKQLESKLRESEERYRTLVENAGEAIATVDPAGVFQFMNATAARRLGGQPGDFVGKTMWDLFPREIAERQMVQIRQVLETGRGRNSIAPSYVQGQMRWYTTTIEPLRDSAGTVVSGLVIARDIHELKKAQDELDSYREKMIRAEQLASLGTLSATLAHELTQPLTVIRLSIQNSLKDLEEIPCPARVLEDLKDGLMEVSSVTAIAERFRNFARRSAEKLVRKVAVHAVVERVMGPLRESARRLKVTLLTNDLEALPRVCMPEKDLEQLVFALAQNAIQAANGQKNAEFRITGLRNGPEVELQFADNCGGIATEDLPRVFEPFFTTKPASEGTGLGLCIVQRVVSDAHGQIRVQTDFGHGTTFTVTLPIPGD